MDCYRYSNNNGSRRDNNRRKPVICRSTFMRAEEIEQERARSGWNQYAGEEEDDWVMDEQQTGRRDDQMMNEGQREMERRDGRMMDGREMESREMERRDGWMMNDRRMECEEKCMMQPQARPYFVGTDYEQVLEEQRTLERDLRMLQSMYPETAKMLLPYIEEACDRMEYEGSMMFDRFPDQTTIQRMQDEIYQNVRDQFPEEEESEAPDEMLSMQYQDRRRRRRGNRVEDLIRVLLLQEMHHRRGRHRNRRRRY